MAILPSVLFELPWKLWNRKRDTLNFNNITSVGMFIYHKNNSVTTKQCVVDLLYFSLSTVAGSAATVGVQNITFLDSSSMISEIIVIVSLYAYILTWKIILELGIATAWLNSEERNGYHQVSRREWSQSHRAEVEEAIMEKRERNMS